MNKQLLICTDLDRTLIPNGIQSESAHARKLFSFLTLQNFITLAYVSGRDIKLIDKAIKNYQLPIPDYIIADVGASLYQKKVVNDKTNWQFIKPWQDIYKKDWNNKTNKEISLLFSDLTELRKQESNKQKPYKLSYYVPLYINYKAIVSTMQERLEKENIKAELIWSVDEPNNIGLLDVMPAHATKRSAIEYLMTQTVFNLQNTVFSGDSGNDLGVILSSIKSTLVANAHKSIKQQALTHINNSSDKHSIYLAKGNFLSMNGNYSAGILEGICHYFPELFPFLKEKNENL